MDVEQYSAHYVVHALGVTDFLVVIGIGGQDVKQGDLAFAVLFLKQLKRRVGSCDIFLYLFFDVTFVSFQFVIKPRNMFLPSLLNIRQVLSDPWPVYLRNPVLDFKRNIFSFAGDH